ncbi:MAG TPA: CpsD/CapB family tyrosine-protein kinase [Terracidiphilus sp.]|jgi:capsular exopolysaccharide synthesis family protein
MIQEMPRAGRAIDVDTIPADRCQPMKACLPCLGEQGDAVEQFRNLRSRMYEFRGQSAFKSVVVSSAMAGEGKSFVAANLAVSLARNTNQKVMLIDADMRRPTLHGLLGTRCEPGLADYLMGIAELDQVIRRYQRAPESRGEDNLDLNLYLMPAGKKTEHATECLSGHGLAEMMSILSATFDWVVIDSPPVLMFADAVDLARVADSVLLVARGGRTSVESARKAQSSFRSSRLLGLVLNAVKNPPNSDELNRYYQGYQR